jgi:hypothetical protein
LNLQANVATRVESWTMIAVVSGILGFVVLGNRLMRLWSASDGMRKEKELRREGRLVREIETTQKQKLGIVDTEQPELSPLGGRHGRVLYHPKRRSLPWCSFPKTAVRLRLGVQGHAGQRNGFPARAGCQFSPGSSNMLLWSDNRDKGCDAFGVSGPAVTAVVVNARRH